MKWKVLAVGVRLVGLGLWLAACNLGGAPCDSTSCPTGCCDSAGVCQPGFSSSACGPQGGSCAVCSEQQYCQLGVCATLPPSLPGPGIEQDAGTLSDPDGGVSCSAPKQVCSGQCVDTQSSPQHCGGCGVSCGAQACVNGQCQPLPQDCTVTACPSPGFYCDTPSKQCKPGCANSAQCSGELNDCNPQTHQCQCSANSCGADEFCAPDGTCQSGCSKNSQCTGTNMVGCDLTLQQCACKSGFHLCNGKCVSNTDPATCGNSCSPCPAPANATGICDGTSCQGFTCNPLHYLDSSQCLPMPPVTVAAGDDFTCAVDVDGGASCWGKNGINQLGDGTIVNKSTPTPVPGFSPDAGVGQVVMVSAGGRHACALTSTGVVKCWGAMDVGQSTQGYSSPLRVGGLAPSASYIVSGEEHACALLGTGEVKCWGNNGRGQLGDGTKVHRPAPVTVVQLGPVKHLTAAFTHTCALTTGGGAKCWGGNGNGRLGDGTTVDSSSPVDVAGLSSGVTRISARSVHTCALTSGGAAMCWGSNYDGRLGDGTTTDRWVPTFVSGLTSGVKGLAAGNVHSCAHLGGSSIKCWGANDEGQLGDGTTAARTGPVNALLDAGVLEVSATNHTCVRLAGGGLKCWGSNDYGQLGDGTTSDRTKPVNVVYP